VLLTYDSDAVVAHHRLSPEYLAAIKSEAEAAWNKFEAKLSVPLAITVHMILMPLRDKQRVRDLMHEKLRLWQNI
jgi:hypothetical protein